jgi:antitoxin (DNA-binding transcriptional repressor) of toxin-antitoxin stability system
MSDEIIMDVVTLQQAQAALADLTHRLNPGEEVVITENEQPVAKLMASPVEKARPQPGRCKGMITLEIEDDEQLEHFNEYMP